MEKVELVEQEDKLQDEKEELEEIKEELVEKKDELEHKKEEMESVADSHASRIASTANLERKHSSGDLQSRLKTRKILGVGETDNGDVHRSKISQVLGHNEHLFVKFPRLYWLWHLSMAILFTAAGFTNIFTSFAPHDGSLGKDDSHPLRMMTTFYGSVLVGFSFLLWSFFGTTDKALARGLMSAIVITQLAQLIALLSFAYKNSIWDSKSHTDILVRLFLLSGSGYYFWAIGSSRAGLRRALSNKDLRQPDGGDSSPTAPDFVKKTD